MIELEQYKQELNSYTDRLSELAKSFHIEETEKQISELEAVMEKPDFWDDSEKAQKTVKAANALKKSLEDIKNLQEQFDDVSVMIEMAEEDEDALSAEELKEALDSFIAEFDRVKISALLSDEYDDCDAVIKINAGAGGTESCDWASMLYRMYLL